MPNINIVRKHILNARVKNANTKSKVSIQEDQNWSKRLGQKNFKQTSTHKLLYAFLDSLGFHGKLVHKLKTPTNEKMVDELAHTLMPFIHPEILKIPNHYMRSRVKTRD